MQESSVVELTRCECLLLVRMYLFTTFRWGPPQRRLWGDPTFLICAMFTAATRRLPALLSSPTLKVRGVRSGVLHWGIATSHSAAKTLFGRDPRCFISAIFQRCERTIAPTS